MIPIAEMVLVFAWTFGANGFLIDRQLDGAQALPVAWLEPVADQARIVFHGREDWAMAFYVPATADDRLPPSEASHQRLALYAPYYLAAGGVVELSRMPVDVADYYFQALIEAALDLELDQATSPQAYEAEYAGWMKQRAAELMVEVPEAQQLSAYISALADFGAHMLAIRNEVVRAAERQAIAGRDVCRQLALSASLFGLWRRSLTEGRYAGDYFALDESGSPRWTSSRQALSERDKKRFLTEFFGVTWSGDPSQDFEEICPAVSRGS